MGGTPPAAPTWRQSATLLPAPHPLPAAMTTTGQPFTGAQGRRCACCYRRAGELCWDIAQNTNVRDLAANVTEFTIGMAPGSVALGRQVFCVVCRRGPLCDGCAEDVWTARGVAATREWRCCRHALYPPVWPQASHPRHPPGRSRSRSRTPPDETAKAAPRATTSGLGSRTGGVGSVTACASSGRSGCRNNNPASARHVCRRALERLRAQPARSGRGLAGCRGPVATGAAR